MNLKQIKNVNIEPYLGRISKKFDLSEKEFICIGIDYEKLDSITKDKFSDVGDLIPEWTIFIIDLVGRIIKEEIKEKEENVILIRENSLKNRLMNYKFITPLFTLSDFIDTCFQYLNFDLGFFLVWKIEYTSNSEITSFGGLITPIIGGSAIICLADKNDPILKHIKNSCLI